MLEENHIRATIGVLRDLSDRSRAEADRLESLLPAVGYQTAFDPRTDTPPVTPMVKGTAAQENWCTLLLFGGLLAHEVDHGRGATDAESREIAAAAGYETSNRAWNGWVPRGWERNELNLRSLDADGMRRVRDRYDEVGRTLPDDLAAALRERAETGHSPHVRA